MIVFILHKILPLSAHIFGPGELGDQMRPADARGEDVGVAGFARLSGIPEKAAFDLSVPVQQSLLEDALEERSKQMF